LKAYPPAVIAEFTSLMASLLAAGSTAQGALEICRSMGGVRLRSLCENLKAQVDRGKNFAASIKASGAFPPLYEALAAVGEETGEGALVFGRLADYGRRAEKMKGRLRSALAYPLLVLTAAVGGTAALLFVVLPRMAEVFAVFGGEEEAAVQIGNMYRSVIILASVLLLILLATGTAFVSYRTSDKAAAVIDAVLIKLPVAGALISALATLDLFFAMECCGKTGMNAAAALASSSMVVGNRAFRAETGRILGKVEKGGSVATAFREGKLFPQAVGTWLAVGEATGEGENVYARIREIFETQVEERRETALALMEPAIILVTGILILLLVMNLVVPLYSLYGAGL
jgi:type II secretory pathway component PulF